MLRCNQCGAVSPDTARFCPKCGFPFQGEMEPLQRVSELRNTRINIPRSVQPQKKQRSFLVGLLGLLGLRYHSHTHSWGCAFIPTTISVGLIGIIITYVIAGPVLKQLPPFASNATNLTIIGTIAPGASVIIHGTNFPSGSRINLTLDGVGIALASTSQHSMFQSSYVISLSVVQGSSFGQRVQRSSPDDRIIVGNDGTFNVQIRIPQTWQRSSKHLIQAQAIGKNNHALASVQQTVIMPGGNSNGNIAQKLSNASPTPLGRHLIGSFSGAFSGSTVTNVIVLCGVSKNVYNIRGIASFNSKDNNSNLFIIGINHYKGAGTYNFSLNATFFGIAYWDTALSSTFWVTTSIGSITINSDAKSGVFSGSMFRTNKYGQVQSSKDGQVQFTGSWKC